MSEKKIPLRSEVRKEDTWDLSDIFKSDECWFDEYKALKEIPAKAVSFRGKLGESAETLLAFLKLQDEISFRIEQLYGYAMQKNDEDLGNNFYQDMRGKAMGTLVELSGAAAFSVPEICAIPDETLNAWYDECEGLKTYRRSLYLVRRRKLHMLSAECETLLASAGEMAQSPETIGSVFRNADMKFPSVKDADGSERQLTDGTLVLLLENSDRVLRKNAFEAYYSRMNEFKNTFAAILDAHFKQLKFFADSRGYGSTLEASLDRTEVPTEVYHNLIAAVHENLDKMYKYVSLRKKLLGVDELHMYDVYTPIVKDAAETITYEEAKKKILSALSVLGDDYTAILREGFENRWIDVYQNVGKRGGAYSSMGRPHPYVLLNHKDNLDSMFTIAHEMGHSIHSYLSCKNQPFNTSSYVIFVAEVASTVNEILLMRHLLKETSDRRSRGYLINHFLDQFKGTVFRQTMFAEFELELGRMCEKRESLTADALCAKYLELNKTYFGPDMVSDDGIAFEWTRIPHFFYDYYVFQYATGFSAAVAISNRILKEGAAAVADYKKFLSGGCSTDPISLLKIAGVDMSTPEPVNSALDLFGELVEEMSALTRE